MPAWYSAECVKEIYWRGETYRPGDRVHMMSDDVHILAEAGVVGDVKKIVSKQRETESAVVEPPEKRRRKRRQ